MIILDRETINKLGLISEYTISKSYNVKHTEVRKACYYKELVPYGQTEKGLYYFMMSEVKHYLDWLQKQANRKVALCDIENTKKVEKERKSVMGEETKLLGSIITAQDVAGMLGCTKQKVYDMRKNGQIKESWCVLQEKTKTYKYKRDCIEDNKDKLIEYLNKFKTEDRNTDVYTEKELVEITQGSQYKIRLLRTEGIIPTELYRHLSVKGNKQYCLEKDFVNSHKKFIKDAMEKSAEIKALKKEKTESEFRKFIQTCLDANKVDLNIKVETVVKKVENKEHLEEAQKDFDKAVTEHINNQTTVEPKKSLLEKITEGIRKIFG